MIITKIKNMKSWINRLKIVMLNTPPLAMLGICMILISEVFVGLVTELRRGE
jgi:hypothetical protein